MIVCTHCDGTGVEPNDAEIITLDADMECQDQSCTQCEGSKMQCPDCYASSLNCRCG